MNPIERADAELVAAVLGGRRDDYAGLVRRHQESVYRYARGMGFDHDTGVDLVQDAFVKAYTRLNECREPTYFRAWLFRIARNLCLDYLKNVRRSTVSFSALPDAEHIPDHSHTLDELTYTLRAALARLPLAQREAFLLKHDADYTYEEVAELTNATPSAVKMRVHRARETLREFLASQDVCAA